MRNSFILLTLFLITASLKAQNVYTYKAYAETYKNLVKTISLNNSQTEDVEETGPYDVPFSFKIAGQTITHFDFEDNNFVFFTGLSRGTDTKYYLTAISDIGIQDTQAGVSEQEALNKEASENTSDLEYSYYIVSVEGIAGSRILKLEVKNSGSESEFDLNESNNLSENFQIWIYEGTNVIEYRYGDTNISASNISVIEDGIQMGVARMNEVNGFAPYRNLFAPTVEEFFNGGIVDLNIDYVMTSYPTNARVCQFTPSISTAAEQFHKIESRIYPNPVTQSFCISLENMDSTDYIITDITGKIIQKGNFTDLENTVDITDVNSGMYFIKIGSTVQKILKK